MNPHNGKFPVDTLSHGKGRRNRCVSWFTFPAPESAFYFPSKLWDENDDDCLMVYHILCYRSDSERRRYPLCILLWRWSANKLKFLWSFVLANGLELRTKGMCINPFFFSCCFFFRAIEGKKPVPCEFIRPFSAVFCVEKARGISEWRDCLIMKNESCRWSRKAVWSWVYQNMSGLNWFVDLWAYFGLHMKFHTNILWIYEINKKIKHCKTVIYSVFKIFETCCYWNTLFF